MTTPERPARAGWLKTGAIGCAAVLALAILAAGVIVGLTYRGYGRALAIREQLDQRYGTYDSYRVARDGSVPADRMARFLTVRRVLMSRCREVTDATESFRRVQAAASEGEPDVTSLLVRLGEAVRRLPSIGLIFGEYVTDRNTALLEQGMGLGEYTWIYVVSYFAALGQTPIRVLDRSAEVSPFQARVFPAMARAIERHAAAAGMTNGPWVEELARLKRDRARVPFAGHLPPALASSIDAHRATLAALACPAAAELDLTLTVRRSVVGYDHR